MAFPIYAVVGIPVIFLLGFAGAIIPSIIAFFFPSSGILRRLFFSFFSGMAGGLILAVGFVHSVPDSFESFDEVMEESDASEMTRDYAWPAWIAMMGVLLCFGIEELVDFLSTHFGVASAHSHSHGNGAHAHEVDEEELKTVDKDCSEKEMELECFQDLEKCDSDAVKNEDGQPVEDTKDKKESKDKKEKYAASTRGVVKMLVLFFGLIFHNIFVGLALGTADNDEALFIAIIFHQFFEGFGLGARVADSGLKKILTVLCIDFLFAVSAPVGIGIGLGIKAAVENGSMAYATVDGTFQALSGGILIYVALIHMMRAYKDALISEKEMQIHRLISYTGCCLGAAVMSVIGIWA